MADTSDNQIDEQLAADIDARAVAQLRELVIQKIQRECDIQEASVAAAWQTIQNSVNALNRKKQVIFATLKMTESMERAQRVFDDDVRNMMPPTFKKIEEAMRDRDGAGHLPSPVVSPRLNNPDDFDRRSFTYEAAPSDFHDALLLPTRPARLDGLPEFSAALETPSVSPSKRKSNPDPTTPSTSKKKQRQSNICQQQQQAAGSCPEHTADIQPAIQPTIKIDKKHVLQYWEVEGKDYLFQDPRVGKDWLCVRCNWNEYLSHVQFAQHPLESGCALDHFNNKKVKCHDTSRSYTWEDILREFAFRIDDDDLNEELVKTNNELAREKAAAKTPRGKAKAKSKQVGYSPANRAPVDPPYAPEANMGLSDAEKLVNEAVEEALQQW